MNIFNIKKLSWKIAFIVVTAVVLVSGSVSIYLQSRLLGEIHKNAQLNMKFIAMHLKDEFNLALSEAVVKVDGLRSFAETVIDLDEFMQTPDAYFDGHITPHMSAVIKNVIAMSKNVWGVYFAMHPNLAGDATVREVYYVKDGDDIVPEEPTSYEEYQQVTSEYMKWFYAAYNTGQPYWTKIHDYQGTMLVCYTEPVIVNGTKVGVIGIDLPINDIIEMLKKEKVFEAGFALLLDNEGNFFESNSIISTFNAADKEAIGGFRHNERNDVFRVKLSGNGYVAAKANLINDYELYVLDLLTEYNSQSLAAILIYSIILLTVILITIIVSAKFGKKFSEPLIAATMFFKKAGTTGDLNLGPEDMEKVAKYCQINDEIGELVISISDFINRMRVVSDELSIVSDGDLTSIPQLLSEDDMIGLSLQKMLDNLNNMFIEIDQTAAQVASGADQLAIVAQSLAYGASEQASSVEKLSNSLNEISVETKSKVENGTAKMNQMVKSVEEINNASIEINSIIKIIDNIAFQTNVLALNASVEAARAGANGKGFMVVAEEVKDLANRSHEAALETDHLIEKSVKLVENGMAIARETQTALQSIADTIEKLSAVMKGIDQISTIVQQNSAIAEETAASSSAMNNQSDILRKLLNQFKLRDVSEY